jgi:isoquinoline 1-oxidoreductase beta subunit
MYPTMLSKRATTPSSRRNFLIASATGAGALIIGCAFGKGADAEEAANESKAGAGPKATPMPDAFIRIAPDDSVTVLIKHLDMGQGVTTGLTTIVAEELDADWLQMRAEFAPANAKLYNNFAFESSQDTGESTSVANSWDQLRLAAAAARAMLVAAAAEDWKVSASEITVHKGRLSHQSGKSGSFGEFAEKAARQPLPGDLALKDPAMFGLIGAKTHRIDSNEKTTGRATYAQDIRRPHMLTAVIARPRRFGGTVKSFDANSTKAVKGVVDVIAIPQGVAVLAENTWAAIQGRDALKVQWDESKAEHRSSIAMLDEYKKLAATPGAPALKKGDADLVLAKCAKTIEAEFTFPYLAHAPMEPLNCTIEKTATGCEIWAGSQSPTDEQFTAATILGLRPDQAKIHTLWAGGSFGRRSTPNADYIAEAATILRASGGKRPIHLIWTREDDITGGRYRPMFYHSIRAGLDASGELLAWSHRLAGQSFIVGTPLETDYSENGVDVTAVEGIVDMPYGIPNMRVDWRNATSPVTTLWWRSAGHSHTAHAVEVMIDELAYAANKDPLRFRLALLKNQPRHAIVLNLAAEKADFGKKLPSGKGRGLALHESRHTIVAMAVDVSIAGSIVKVDRVVAALDCGIAVNPDVIKAQIESGVGFGLGPALRNKITLTDGLVDQANFDSYEPLRLSEMPAVEVHIVKSNQPPTGVGEPGVPAIAPAISNAIFAATGKRLRSLPFEFELLSSAARP